MYVDEVGNADLNSSDDPNHRFLSLTGVIVELGHVEQVIHPQMESLKRGFFRSHPDEPVILHRRELIQANHPFEPLRDASVRKQSDHQLLTLLEAWQYVVISVCLDKKKHKRPLRGPDGVRHPPPVVPDWFHSSTPVAVCQDAETR